MEVPSSPKAFTRRQKIDGTSDSICLKCFLTVSVATDDRKKGALDRAEHTHQCSAKRLRRLATKVG